MNRTEDIYEKLYHPKGKTIMGIDEAGRGPICGPLVVACCVLPCGYQNEQIYDSKKLSNKRRELLYDVIREVALYYKIEVVSPRIIDENNIYQATKMAMERLAMSYPVDLVITDAMKLDIAKEHIALIKGDQKSISIAAASIIAKVTRDRLMREYDRLYPQYGFAGHKGYGSAEHIRAIREHGPCPIHRRTFLKGLM